MGSSSSRPLGARTSRGPFDSAYRRAAPWGQRPPPEAPAMAATSLPSQGLWPSLPARALESALLPRSGVSSARAALAGREASAQTPPFVAREARARRTREGSPHSAAGARGGLRSSRPRTGAGQGTRRRPACSRRCAPAWKVIVRPARLLRSAPRVDSHERTLLRRALPSGGAARARSRAQVAAAPHEVGTLQARAGVRASARALAGGRGARCQRARTRSNAGLVSATSIRSSAIGHGLTSGYRASATLETGRTRP